MAKRSRSQENIETDRIEGVDHPRKTARLVGQDRALAIVSRALRSGRPPQAWLICGPPGVGKATLAYRIARYLLAFGASDDGINEALIIDVRDVAEPCRYRAERGTPQGARCTARPFGPGPAGTNQKCVGSRAHAR